MVARKKTLKAKVKKAPREKRADGKDKAGRPKMVFPVSTINKVCDMMILELKTETCVLKEMGIDRAVWCRQKREDKMMKEALDLARKDMIEGDLDEMVALADVAFDRDSAAAATIKVKARETRARMSMRATYGTPLAPHNNRNGMRVGIVVLPPKTPTSLDHQGNATIIDIQAIPQPLEQPRRVNRLLQRPK